MHTIGTIQENRGWLQKFHTSTQFLNSNKFFLLQFCNYANTVDGNIAQFKLFLLQKLIIEQSDYFRNGSPIAVPASSQMKKGIFVLHKDTFFH